MIIDIGRNLATDLQSFIVATSVNIGANSFTLFNVYMHPDTLSLGLRLNLLKKSGSCTLDIKKYLTSHFILSANQDTYMLVDY